MQTAVSYWKGVTNAIDNGWEGERVWSRVPKPVLQVCASLSGREMKGTAPLSPSGAMGSTVLHSQHEPVGAGEPKSSTGTQLVGHTSPWEAVSALLLLLGLLHSLAPFNPVLLSHVRNRWLFASFLVLVSPQAHRGLLPLMQMPNFICYSLSVVQPLCNTTSHLWGLALTSSAERFQANKKPLKGLRSQSNEKGWALFSKP